MTQSTSVARLAFSLLTIALLCDAAIGGVISRDWKSPGDGLLTYDDVSHREWLDLAQSRLSSFPGDTGAARYQSVLASLQPGGTLHGFTAANSSDLRALAQSAGIDVMSLEFGNEPATTRLIELVGPTASVPSSASKFVVGVLQADGLLQATNSRFGQLLVAPIAGMFGSAGLLTADAIEPFQLAGLGVWLYRDQIPEPNSMVIVLTCTSLLFRRRT